MSGWLDKLERSWLGVPPGVTIQGEVLGGLLPEEVSAVVNYMAIRYQKLPVDAKLDKETGQIIKEQNGSIVDVEANIAQIMEATEGAQLKLIIHTVYPQYRKEDLQEVVQVIGSYQTWIGGSKERHSNIALAAKSLNNTLIYIGDVFSFNNVVGPRTEARGYLPAPVIISGSMEIDYGGGVCQASSTLFNAADKAGLKIIERHMHSRPVKYVPEGRDAAVAYNALDLKLKNRLDSPVIIKAGLAGNSLWVNILGRKQ